MQKVPGASHKDLRLDIVIEVIPFPTNQSFVDALAGTQKRITGPMQKKYQANIELTMTADITVFVVET